jgi:hypothetical protein
MNFLSFKKSYELPLSRDYVRHWGMAEAVRELLQNALDSDSPFEYELNDSTLFIHSRQSSLSPATLLLGNTTKADRAEKIGSFGEGYKIALLVLTREEYPVRVLINDRVWRPRFMMSRQFKAEVLCIEDAASDAANVGVTFEVGGLSPADVAAVRDSCLQMQPSVGEVLQTKFGRILRERPGKLYVGGLFVCNTQMRFGYDVLPQYLKLERDRQTVSSWNMQLRTKDMWFETERHEEIAQLLSENCKDLEYAEHGAPELVKEACYKLFQKKHPGSVVAKDQEELEQLVERGMTKVVVVSGAYGELVRTSAPYTSSVRVRVPSPKELLEEWFETYGGNLGGLARQEFNALLNQASRWRVGLHGGFIYLGSRKVRNIKFISPCLCAD